MTEIPEGPGRPVYPSPLEPHLIPLSPSLISLHAVWKCKSYDVGLQVLREVGMLPSFAD